MEPKFHYCDTSSSGNILTWLLWCIWWNWGLPDRLDLKQDKRHSDVTCVLNTRTAAACTRTRLKTKCFDMFSGIESPSCPERLQRLSEAKDPNQADVLPPVPLYMVLMITTTILIIQVTYWLTHGVQ